MAVALLQQQATATFLLGHPVCAVHIVIPLLQPGLFNTAVHYGLMPCDAEFIDPQIVFCTLGRLIAKKVLTDC